MRKYYIDNLRWISVLFLIPYHAAMAWNVWGEPNYIFFEKNRCISSIIVFVSPYFMPLLFLLAGISTRYALQKRTYWQYIAERFQKLFLPFVSGTLLLMPPMTYLADKFHNGYRGSLFGHYRVFFTRFTDLTGADGGFSVGQFWFVLYLFCISMAAVCFIAIFRKIRPEHFQNIPIWMICFLGLPLPCFHELLSVGGKSIAEFTYIFLAGYYIFSNEQVVQKMEAYRRIFLGIGFMATILQLYLFLWTDAAFPYLNLTEIMKYVSEWFMLPALYGFGKKYLTRQGKVSVYMSQRSFAFYMLHYLPVVLTQYFFADICGAGRICLYVMPVLSAYVITFLCCEAGVKFFGFGLRRS